MSGVVFTVGNSLRGDDGAGPLLATLLEASPAEGWTLVDGEASPENHTHRVRALTPDRVLIVDAADMELAPGEVRLLDEDCVAEHFLVTTHAIPLNFLIASLRETVPEIIFLGVQPKDTAFCNPLTPEVRRAVEMIHQRLVQGDGFDLYQAIA
ncbi:MAG: hydrogenase maturation peptidase HycI [Acetobacteraceae bacterium]|nr:hydrogenase maturation peptidase HycI [Acetobacteraceae bacterium]